jgi:hypothetical protein
VTYRTEARQRGIAAADSVGFATRVVPTVRTLGLRAVAPVAVALLAAALLAVAALPARADGVTAYIPLNLEPEMERQIERVLILANEPILKRPIPVNLVELALPEACKHDKALCNKVKHYLERFSHDYGVSHASATASATRGADGTVPNAYGEPLNSKYDISAQAYVQPNDYFLATAGVIAYKGRVNPTGSVLSFGTNWAQVDIGYRDHWFSPVTDSTMMIGTEAPTMPSVTVSNYEPLTRLGFQYELFLAQMAKTDRILGGGQGTTVETRGNPKLFGAQFSIEPFSGWSLGVNRQLQYGGGGLPDSASFLAKAFFEPGGYAQTQGNQEASYISRFIFPGRTPFAFYVQYAGENTLDGGSYLLGESSLAMGIDFPKLWHFFDLTYEITEWQNAWYINSVFLEGMTNDGFVLGHWGGDQRVFNDGVGARSQMLRIGWEPPFGGYLEERVRELVNQTYGIYPYKHYLDVTVRYSRPLNDVTVGGEVLAGRDVFGKSFSQLSAFVRYGGPRHTRDYDSDDDDDTDGATDDQAGTELFVDAGGNVNQVKVNVQPTLPIETSKVNFGPHFAIGARRAVTDNADLGVRLEVDQVDNHNLIGVRPVDYRYRFGESFALDLFAGVNRYNVATPAYSLYAGVGAEWRNIIPKWDIGVDYRYAQNIARNHVLPTDPAGPRPDTFYKMQSVIAYISRHF